MSVDSLPTTVSKSVNSKQLSANYSKYNTSLCNMRSNTNGQNDIKQLVNDTRISPQTNSSGYHSDLSCLSSANESPQLDVQSETNNRCASLAINSTVREKSATICQTKDVVCAHHDKQESNNITSNKSRLHSFLRRQYQKAKQKLSTKSSSIKKSSSDVTTTTPIAATSTLSSNITDTSFDTSYNSGNISNNQKKQPKQYFTSVYQHSACNEPVYSMYIHPTHQLVSKSDYIPIHECYSTSSQQPYYSAKNYTPLSTAKISNYEYLHNSKNYSFLNNGHKMPSWSGMGQLAKHTNNYYYPYTDNFQQHRNYPVHQQQIGGTPTHSMYSHYSQLLAPYPQTIPNLILRAPHPRQYQYTNDNYEYVYKRVLPPLSDKYYQNYIPISECSQQLRNGEDDGKSAFKPLRRNIPIKLAIPSTTNLISDDLINDKLCDLEVAKYFKDNPNYFDIYNESTNHCSYSKTNKQLSQNYAETLC
ncbi:unnamed protein product [Didymodactylos carnosus]|uniref:Uncharacterized protein n=1 Tax=Didymodactylos carnosus TaxID=1234261 RepID=A0A813YTV8_9BILA|nr:unnamed protein product [Didymodactylos carnosus]CAF1070600.1 unnamed protein product [Didymodactylos carnosus]CAF3674279.1 unnamed protein product [Didymodactylos carnosus]CAF3834985.1 unnamed protein product [Didymodactylos carnosus]